MVIYSWVILKEIIANPQRRDEKLPSNAFYNTYLSPLLIAYSDLQAALFISSWTKLKCINDQFHRLRLNIRGQTFAQWKLQMIWIREILQYRAAIHNAEVRVSRETITDEMLPSKVHNFVCSVKWIKSTLQERCRLITVEEPLLRVSLYHQGQVKVIVMWWNNLVFT